MKLYIKIFIDKTLILAGFLLMFVHPVGASDQICPSPLPQQYQNVQPGKIVSAYFGNWDVYGGNHYQIERIGAVADKLTHLIYGFMKPDATEGVCKSHDIWADLGAYEGYQSKVGGNFAQLAILKQKYPHLKILLSIGGGTYNKNFITLAHDKTKLFKFAQSCVDMLDFYDHPFLMDGQFKRKNHLAYEGLFDGLDIDWEWEGDTLTPALAQVYLEFMQELRRLLTLRESRIGKPSLLTIALQVNPKVYKTLPLAAIVQSIDWFNVMAYDFFGPGNKTIGLNAPMCGDSLVYTVDGALKRIMEQGVSPEKMVLGLPLYGYVYENTQGLAAPINKQNASKAVSYHVIEKKYLHDASYEKIWNKKEDVPSLYSKKDRTFISYDGKESLVKKVEFAQNKRMQGVVLWRLSGDNEQHTMVDAIVNAMHASKI